MNPIRLRLVSGDASAVDRLRHQIAALGYRSHKAFDEKGGHPEWVLDPLDSHNDLPPESAILEAVLNQMDDPAVSRTRTGNLSPANPPAHEFFPEANPGTSPPERRTSGPPRPDRGVRMGLIPGLPNITTKRGKA